MKILIVDDSKAMRMIVKRTLSKTDLDDFTTTEAENGAEALEVASTTHFDLILCDWNMPEMSGIDFLTALRAKDVRTTFGFITSEIGEDMKALADERGAQFMVAKPFNAEALNSAVMGATAS